MTWRIVLVPSTCTKLGSYKCGSKTGGSNYGCIKCGRSVFPTRHVIEIVTVVIVKGVQEVHVQRMAKDDGHPSNCSCPKGGLDLDAVLDAGTGGTGRE